MIKLSRKPHESSYSPITDVLNEHSMKYLDHLEDNFHLVPDTFKELFSQDALWPAIEALIY